MNYRLLATLSILLILVLGGYRWLNSMDEGVARLIVYSDRTLEPPLIELARMFKEYMASKGINVNITFIYGSSGYALSQLKLHGYGDLYVADDRHFAEVGLREGLLDNKYYNIIGYLHLTLIVGEGNPLNITSLKDALSRDGITIALGNPEHVSAGILAMRLLDKLGYSPLIDSLVREGRIIYVNSAAEAASSVRLGVADAALTFNIYPELDPNGLDVVYDPLVENVSAPVVVAIPVNHGSYSIEFYRFIVDNRGVFERYGVDVP